MGCVLVVDGSVVTLGSVVGTGVVGDDGGCVDATTEITTNKCNDLKSIWSDR